MKSRIHWLVHEMTPPAKGPNVVMPQKDVIHYASWDSAVRPSMREPVMGLKHSLNFPAPMLHLHSGIGRE